MAQPNWYNTTPAYPDTSVVAGTYLYFVDNNSDSGTDVVFNTLLRISLTNPTQVDVIISNRFGVIIPKLAYDGNTYLYVMKYSTNIIQRVTNIIRYDVSGLTPVIDNTWKYEENPPPLIPDPMITYYTIDTRFGMSIMADKLYFSLNIIPPIDLPYRTLEYLDLTTPTPENTRVGNFELQNLNIFDIRPLTNDGTYLYFPYYVYDITIPKNPIITNIYIAQVNPQTAIYVPMWTHLAGPFTSNNAVKDLPQSLIYDNQYIYMSLLQSIINSVENQPNSNIGWINVGNPVIDRLLTWQTFNYTINALATDQTYLYTSNLYLQTIGRLPISSSPTPTPSDIYSVTSTITFLQQAFINWSTIQPQVIATVAATAGVPIDTITVVSTVPGSIIVTLIITGFLSCSAVYTAISALNNIVFNPSLGDFRIDNSPDPRCPSTISNICFPAGTPVQTDQGVVPIERLQSQKHTLAGQAIQHLTQTVTLDPYLICIEPHALDYQSPTAKTILTKDHRIFYKGQMVPAERLLRVSPQVTKVKYTGEVLYNVLLADHSTMRINNLVCETLHPDNAIAILYRNNFSAASKQYLLQNSPHSKTLHPTYKRLVHYLT